MKCLGRIEAEFWETDVENTFDGEKAVKLLKVMESQWPGEECMSHRGTSEKSLAGLFLWSSKSE